MGLTGRLTGLILLVFEDRSGLALVDLLLHQPVGTTTAWGELEQSAAKETTNIVGCAYVNALAAHLPDPAPIATSDAGELIPTPPTFLHEFAGSLLEFALMEQALELDQVLLIHSEFAAGRQGLNLNWTLLFIPSRDALHALAASLAQLESPHQRREVVDRADSRLDRFIGIARRSSPWRSVNGPSPRRRPGSARCWARAWESCSTIGSPGWAAWPTSSCPGSRGRSIIRQVRRHGDPRHDRRARAAAGRQGPVALTAKLVGGASMFQIIARLRESVLNIGRITRRPSSRSSPN